MPRPPAEAGILLERDAEGRAVAARITWQNVMGEEPQQVTVSFDGRPIAMDALRRVQIPPHSPEVVHVVTVELDFASGLRSRDDVAFGGGAGGEAQSELTAVPIRMTKKRKLVPDGFPGRPARGREAAPRRHGRGGPGEPLDRPRRERDGGLRQALGARRRVRARRPRCLSRRPTRSASSGRARESFRGRPALFPSAGGMTRSDGGLTFLLSHVSNPTPEGLFPMYADAVAVAGLNAFESFGRRAVLLVLGRVAEDASTYQAGGRPALPRSAPRSPLRLVARRRRRRELPLGRGRGRRDARRACARLTPESAKRLDSQRVLWVEGRYLPQEIELAGGANGVELVH